MRMKIRKTAVMLAACMGMTLLAGCDSEQQKTFNEAVKDLEQGSYEYALDEFTQSVNNGISLAVSYRGIGICQMRLGNYEDAISALPVHLVLIRSAKRWRRIFTCIVLLQGCRQGFG